MPVYITDNIEYSSDFDREYSNEKISNKENPDKRHFDEESKVCHGFRFCIWSILSGLGYSKTT